MKTILFVLFLLPGLAFAKLTAAPKNMKELKTEMKDGWVPKLDMGVSYALTDSEAWIGSDTGTSSTVGLNIKGSYNFKGGQHEWRNILGITEASSKSPTLPTWVKSSDEIKLETIYLYNLEKYTWIAPYFKASAQTAIFKGEAVTATPTQYVEDTKHVNAGANIGTATNTFRLTDGFKPLTTKESAGAFFKIITEKDMNLEARIGAGAMQIAADGQLAKGTKNTNGTVNIIRLENINQAGLEFGFDFTGNIDDKTSYDIGFEALVPFVNDDAQDRDAFELMNWEAHAKLTTKLYEMLSVSYEYKLREQPELLDEIQTQHLLLANLTYTFF